MCGGGVGGMLSAKGTGVLPYCLVLLCVLCRVRSTSHELEGEGASLSYDERCCNYERLVWVWSTV